MAAALCAGLGMTSQANAELAYAITNTSSLITFDTNAPGTLLSGSFLSGLQQNETIVGLDIRPATGQIYALGSTSRLYTLSTTGVATQVGAPFSTSLNGSSFGFDFNPTIDRSCVVSDVDQNLVLNPITGAVQLVATPLAYRAADDNAGVNPNVVHSAYTNNFLGATASQLYGVDVGLNTLVKQANNDGLLDTVGPIGADVTDVGGFDISGATGNAYLIVKDALESKSMFWTIDLATGAGAGGFDIGGGATVTAFTVAAVPEPTAIAALVPLAGLLLRRRHSA